MEAKGWGGLDTRQWWFGVLVIAGPSLVAALSTGRENVAIIAAGVITWAFGEWNQHPYQVFRKDGHIGDRYERRANIFGTALNIISVSLVVFGIYRIWKFGAPIF
jgi:hypothetical protein